jgi:thiol-disulfide isomerase/thioredoxin
VGDAPPQLKVSKWLQGSAVRAFDPGKTYVVEFWATWCGPCLQSIPHVAQVHHDSAASGVKVVAVNLEEGPDEIQKLLKRLKLELPVALDRDGAVASKYGVSAIPQTVIIDPEGKVIRHFVGGSSHLAKDLADAIHPQAPPPAKAPEKKTSP